MRNTLAWCVARIIFILFLGVNAANAQEPADAPVYGFGRVPSADLLQRWDIAIGPDGGELPDGRGDVSAGAALYATHCAMCHGATGREGPDAILVGGKHTLTSAKPVLTIGSYWSHATTLYDYIYRAMPFTAPGSLAPSQVYALCAFLLHANGIVGPEAVMDRNSLPLVAMPNRHGFIADPRPDTTSARTPDSSLNH